MRILIYGINFAPELTGIGKYTGEMAEWLASNGENVRVVTAPPYYPEWKIGEGYSSLKYKYENINEVAIWRSPVWIPRNKTGIYRILHLMSFAISSSYIMLKQIFWKPEVIIVIEPTLFCTPTCLFVAKLSGAKQWLHIQDFEIDAALGLGFLASGELYRIAKSIEKKIMKQFDRVSTISCKMMERLTDVVSIEKCVFFPNWVDTNVIYPISRCNFFRKEWGINDDTTVVLYSGNIGRKQGLENIVKVAAKLSNKPNILFVICGEGAYKDQFITLAHGMKNIRFLPLQTIDRFNMLLNTADIHLLPQSAAAEDLVMPSKLAGILSCGGIVITTATENSELANTVSKVGGFVTPPGDVDEIVQIIKDISTTPLKQAEIRIKAREFAKDNLEKETVLSAFYSKLQSCIK